MRVNIFLRKNEKETVRKIRSFVRDNQENMVLVKKAIEGAIVEERKACSMYAKSKVEADLLKEIAILSRKDINFIPKLEKLINV